jgi:ribosomal protein S18 acetylase RimI-like enzyme
MREREDDAAARQALDDWLRQRPSAAIVIAAIDRLPDDTLDITLRLGRVSGYQLIGLVQALLQQAIETVGQIPGVTLDPDFERLRQAKALLDAQGVDRPAALN